MTTPSRRNATDRNGHAAIRIEGLCARYGDGPNVLADVDLVLPTGTRLALIGANGAGKTTLLLHLNGLLQPCSGRVWIDDVEVAPATLGIVRRSVGLVFQDADDQLFCPTVFDDVAFGPRHFGTDEAQIEPSVRRALDRVGLRGFDERAPHRLSAGEKRLAAIASVLSFGPSILALDEPSGQLDPRRRRELIRLLAEIGGTQVIATHDLDLAWELCDRAALLADGRIVRDAPARELLADAALLERHGLELPLRLQAERRG
ncbi:MAG: ABC transporter ATP-binding protein [Phycisphaerales bacterium]